ncbi:MAG: short chain dehydrogenase [Acidimicrobiaceae bacterium]|nr:short chain dehydrogenase [Acidimicrobiaceae bacterium]
MPPYPEGKNLLNGKSVVITAAAGSGIGFATAKRCAEEGAKVFLSDLHERRLNEAVESLCDEGYDATGMLCDVTIEEEVQSLVNAAKERFGTIDVMINNAGLGGQSDLVDMTDEQWLKVIDVTLTGTMRCTRAAMRHMIPNGKGVIVNNASVVGWRAQEGQSHYAAAKAGVMALTRCSALEGAKSGVRINAVAPSFANHPFLAKVSDPDLLETLESQEPFGRGAEPWEVANVIIFLASDLSGYMTGENVSVSSQHP